MLFLGPKERSKASSGSGGPDKEAPLPPLVLRDGLEDKPGYEQRTDPEDRMYDKSPKGGYNGGGVGVKMEGIAGYVPTQRLEWKRYKQYTRSDIVAAIEEVKKGQFTLAFANLLVPDVKFLTVKMQYCTLLVCLNTCLTQGKLGIYDAIFYPQLTNLRLVLKGLIFSYYLSIFHFICLDLPF